VRIASARAGNVIGGGDWAANRIVPDCIRALRKKEPIPVRNRTATRPWQHVLEPLSGYLWLAARLAESAGAEPSLCSAFNFGPGHDANRTVADLVQEVLKHWPGHWEDRSNPKAVHEAHLLQLSTDKAHALLQWMPAWSFEEAVRETVLWYRTAETAAGPAEFQDLTRRQITSYTAAAAERKMAWAASGAHHRRSENPKSPSPATVRL
jgi:CDP-glucose 4,6-dehydratase